MVLLRELCAGSTRFNDLRRGVPRMSPALLSKRLRDLEEGGLIVRVASAGETGVFEYRLTRAGRDAKAVVDAVGTWGQTWVEAQLSLKNLDPSLLMWDMRRNLDLSPLPKRRSVIQFLYPELPSARRKYWLLVDPGGGVDLCSVDPGFDVDLYVSTDLKTMTEIWLGMTTVRGAEAAGKMTLTGDAQLASDMQVWLGLSPFAGGRKLASA
jgi:DNA-binding HxlR family transcriptional regulator